MARMIDDEFILMHHGHHSYDSPSSRRNVSNTTTKSTTASSRRNNNTATTTSSSLKPYHHHNSSSKKQQQHHWEEISQDLIINGLKSRDEATRAHASIELGALVQSASRSLSSETFLKFLNTLTPKLFALVTSRDASHEQLGGLSAIDQLIDVSTEDDEAKIIRFSNYLRNFFVQPSTSKVALERASTTLGHLVRAGGTLTVDFVDFEVNRALEWLAIKSSSTGNVVDHHTEHRRLSACLILSQMAANAPTLFYVYVPRFFELIWVGIRDNRVEIRLAGVKALEAVLTLILHRRQQSNNTLASTLTSTDASSRHRVQWYCLIYEQATVGLTVKSSLKKINIACVHGSLLALGQLVKNTGANFMVPRFKEACNLVLKFRQSKDALIRVTVTELLPVLAGFCPEAFVRLYLDQCLEFLMSSIALASSSSSSSSSSIISTTSTLTVGLSPEQQRSVAYLSLGKLSLAVGKADVSKKHLGKIVSLATDGILSSSSSSAALVCVSYLAQALTDELVPYLDELLESMLSGRRRALNQELIDALSEIVKHVPAFHEAIQNRLVNELAIILSGKPFSTETFAPPAPAPTTSITAAAYSMMGIKSDNTSGGNHLHTATDYNSADNVSIITLALDTLGTFDFSGLAPTLLPFAKNHIIPFVSHENPEIRSHACQSVCNVMMQQSLRYTHNIVYRGPSSVIINDVIVSLLGVAVSDTSARVRKDVITSFESGFDAYLSQAAHLKRLFILLNDESYDVRASTLNLVGRLVNRNPAHVLPALRRMLLQLLSEIQHAVHYYCDSSVVDSISLLGHVVTAAPILIGPYLTPIMDSLLLTLKLHNSVKTASLVTIGHLAVASSSNRGGHGINMPDMLKPYVPKLFPLLIEALSEKYSTDHQENIREVAMRTLGQVAGNTGVVVSPYGDFPRLLETSLAILHDHTTGTSSHISGGEYHLQSRFGLRRETLKTLGILGALDPFKESQHLLLPEGIMNNNNIDSSKATSTSITTTSRISPYSEDYYPTVAISALLEILQEPALSHHHVNVIQALMFIFRSLGGSRSEPFLKLVLPNFVSVMRNCEIGLRESLFQQLANLVGIVKAHVSSFLNTIFDLLRDYWYDNLEQILKLVEELASIQPLWSYDLVIKDRMAMLVDLILKSLTSNSTSNRSSPMKKRGGDFRIKVLRTMVVLDKSLEDYLQLVVPALLSIAEEDENTLRSGSNGGGAALEALGRILLSVDCVEHYAARIIQSSVRVIRKSKTTEVLHVVLDLLSASVVALGSKSSVFKSVIIQSLESLAPGNDTTARMKSQVEGLLREENNIDVEYHYIKTSSTSRSFLGLSTTTFDASSVTPSTTSTTASNTTLHVNQQNLRRAWETSTRSTKEDWVEWMRRFSLELLRESPTPSLRSCSALAQVYHPLSRELFNAAFLSCWNEMHQSYQEYLVTSFETAFQSQSVPPEILQMLLNLAEFMEHEAQALPIDFRTLSDLAEKCHAYAKALHYKEVEFHASPSGSCIEGLISINNQLGQPEAAVGILKFAQQKYADVIHVQESWFEKLQNWNEALQLYRDKQQSRKDNNINLMLGEMRCLEALGAWEELSAVCENAWEILLEGDGDKNKPEVAMLGSRACWAQQEWKKMQKYVEATDDNSTAGSLYRAILAVCHDKFENAASLIEQTRRLLDTEIAGLISESYDRAYASMVTVQQLAELEEIVIYKKLECTSRIDEAVRYRQHLMTMWKDRLDGCKRTVSVWQQLLAVRSLIISPKESIDTWLQYATLCRQSGNLTLSLKVLTGSLGVHGMHSVTMMGNYREFDHHRVVFAYLKHLWAVGKQKAFALDQLSNLLSSLGTPSSPIEINLKVQCHLKLGEWKVEEEEHYDVKDILDTFKVATELNPSCYKAWHSWACMNFNVVQKDSENVIYHVISAINGFFKSIALAGRTSTTKVSSVQQDILRLLTLWFAYGFHPEVDTCLLSGFDTVSIETWLGVIPQLIARIHTPHDAIKRQLHTLLSSVGAKHPQALIYPLSVALKSPLPSRQVAAEGIMTTMRRHYHELVDQALMVSRELIRVAILWHEMWHEGLEEASRLYFGDHNVAGMIATLNPLHAMMQAGPQTIREVSFHQTYGKELEDALCWIRKYERSSSTTGRGGGGHENDLNRAWDIYYAVFRRINKQLPQLTTLELQYVSPALLEARGLDLAVPGTYKDDTSVVRIESFVPTVHVITSKQRPRKVTIIGNDGLDHVFLLKGHEDLRQDERVMQLFGLVNALLLNDRVTSKRDLKIQRYAVIPLSHNAGIVEWVPNCDTLHQLIRDYRESRSILLNIEHRLMLQMASDYDNLCLLQKVEVFEAALNETGGQDLYKVLWLKSINSETWLDRRTTYTKSLAVMSMVGYILGLGDRHPSNLMLDRVTGMVVHIDFGDCFEVAMHREKYPEKIPFRLTRMLTKAMEVSGIEGNFRFTCESVMNVLRENRDSLMAMLEAFVHDPLICWRLLVPHNSPSASSSSVNTTTAPVLEASPDDVNIGLDIEGSDSEDDELTSSIARSLRLDSNRVSSFDVKDDDDQQQHMSSSVAETTRSYRERQLVYALGPEGTAAPREALNQKAVAVIRRVQSKLTGRDFDNETLDVAAQVQRLIDQSTSHENLCQCYIGWCPFW